MVPVKSSTLIMYGLSLIHISFLGGSIYFGTYFGVDTCTGQLFQNIRFFAFLALQELGEVALCQHGVAAELFEGQPHCSLYFRLYLILFVELYAAFIVMCIRDRS